jgi:hypothetical protein
MRSARRTALAAALFVGVVSAASPAVAAEPVIEVETIQDTFIDTDLSAECGVPVTVTLSGTRTTRTFEREGTGPQTLVTVNISGILVSGDNTFRLRDVGADLLRRTPDGTLIFSLIGQLPFQFKGVLKINETTGEVILEPKPSNDAERACAALTD